jgi:hypothetical protein
MPHRIKAGMFVTIRARVTRPYAEGRVGIETPDGEVSITEQMIVGIDTQEIQEGSPVESILANRAGLRGEVLGIRDGEAWVQWLGVAKTSTERTDTLRLARINPA